MSTVTIKNDDLLARATQLAAARQMTVPEMLQRLLEVATVPPPLRPADLPPTDASGPRVVAPDD